MVAEPGSDNSASNRARTGSSETSAAAGSSITATSSMRLPSHRQFCLSKSGNRRLLAVRPYRRAHAAEVQSRICSTVVDVPDPARPRRNFFPAAYLAGTVISGRTGVSARHDRSALLCVRPACLCGPTPRRSVDDRDPEPGGPSAMTIPTEPIGSVPRPQYLLKAMSQFAAGALDQVALEAWQDQAVAETIERFVA